MTGVRGWIGMSRRLYGRDLHGSEAGHRPRRLARRRAVGTDRPVRTRAAQLGVGDTGELAAGRGVADRVHGRADVDLDAGQVVGVGLELLGVSARVDPEMLVADAQAEPVGEWCRQPG